MMIGPVRKPCEVHSKHIPESHANILFHVWPVTGGGPDIEENVIVVCPTGAANIRHLLQHHILLKGNVPYSVARRYARRERELAKLGFQRMSRQEM